MVKVLRIYGYQTDINTRYGSQSKINGIAYANRYQASKGRECAEVWIPGNTPGINDSIIGKDLYVEYGPRNSIVSLEIK